MYDLECPDKIMTASVHKVSQDGYIVMIEEEEKKVNKAFSCLITPQIGDFVSLYQNEDDFYITHILQRSSNDIQVECSGNIELRSNSINLYTTSLNSHIENIKSFFNSMEMNGLALNLKTAILKTFSKTNENTHIEVTNKYDRSFTYINEIEEVQTKLSRHLVEENKIVKANNILATAKNQVKIDGENISLA